MEISGNLVDIHRREIYPAKISLRGRIIEKVERVEEVYLLEKRFILPGLIDAHIHIESSMTTPGSFAAAAVSRGTTGVVSDPHEIANVLGIDGVKFMINDAQKVPLKFWFGAPSCVPATSFESSGATINSEAVRELLQMPGIKYLSEMMNYPGVILNDPEVHNKLIAAKKLGKPIDGHAPGLTGEELKKYISAGISTDHECTTLKEAKEKIGLGMKVLIREGSAARNLDTLKELIRIYPSMVMLCSDDMHPETLADRHINKMVAQLISEGFDVFNTVRSCTINPAIHYSLDAGLLRPGDPADFIIVDDLKEMNVEETWINGEKVFEDGRILFRYDKADHVNKFRSSEIDGSDIRILREKDRFRVIEAHDGDLITKEIIAVKTKGDYLESDPAEDILKIVVKDRYNDGPPAVGFIRGFGLKRGAFASSVAHDSHNIISIGVSDQDIINAINEVVRIKGGLSVADGKTVRSLQLGIAGIMTDLPVQFVAGKYEALSVLVRAMGCRMSAPFMTLSFMALLVIPELKLSDKGLFDGKLFRFVPLFTE